MLMTGSSLDEVPIVLKYYYPEETVENICELLSDLEEVMNKAFSLLPCYDCEHCSYLHDYCEDLEIAELNTKVIITMANSSVSQHLLLKKLKVFLM